MWAVRHIIAAPAHTDAQRAIVALALKGALHKGLLSPCFYTGEVPELSLLPGAANHALPSALHGLVAPDRARRG